MKEYLVRIAKPTQIEDFDVWTGEKIFVRKEFTEAIICAFSEERLKQKVSKLYPEYRVLGIKEI